MLEEAVTASVWDSLAAPVPMPERLTVWAVAFSLIVRLARLPSVGAWLTALTAITLRTRP